MNKIHERSKVWKSLVKLYLTARIIIINVNNNQFTTRRIFSFDEQNSISRSALFNRIYFEPDRDWESLPEHRDDKNTKISDNTSPTVFLLLLQQNSLYLSLSLARTHARAQYPSLHETYNFFFYISVPSTIFFLSFFFLLFLLNRISTLSLARM